MKICKNVNWFLVIFLTANDACRGDMAKFIWHVSVYDITRSCYKKWALPQRSWCAYCTAALIACIGRGIYYNSEEGAEETSLTYLIVFRVDSSAANGVITPIIKDGSLVTQVPGAEFTVDAAAAGVSLILS